MVALMLELLKASLERSPVVRFGEYDYFVHPITDGIPRMDPSILAEVLDVMEGMMDHDVDLIVAPEAMGIPLAVPLSLRTGIPYNVVRKRRYGLPGEVSVEQSTGYRKGDMHINGLKAGDRVLLVDDVISTGGTLRAIVLALRRMGVQVMDIIVVVQKGDKVEELERELGIKIRTLVKVSVHKGKVKVLT